MALGKLVINLAVQQIRALINIEGRIQTLIQPYSLISADVVNRLTKQLTDPSISEEAKNRISRELQKIKQICPTKETLENIIKTKDSLQKTIITVDTKLESLRRTTATTQQIIRVLSPLVITIKALPIPSTTTTVGVQTTLSDTLQNVKDKINIASKIILSADALIMFIRSKLNTINNLLSKIDTIILICSSEGDIVQPVEVINRDQQKPNEQVTNESLLYKGYSIIIRQVQSFEDNLIRRQAIAFNNLGTQSFSSSISFATSDEVLIDQVKIQIDNSL
jgi:hypothetical protein